MVFLRRGNWWLASDRGPRLASSRERAGGADFLVAPPALGRRGLERGQRDEKALPACARICAQAARTRQRPVRTKSDPSGRAFLTRFMLASHRVRGALVLSA